MTKQTTDIEEQKELQELLSKLPENVLAEALAEKIVTQDPTGEITEVVRTVAQEYSGPLPPPKMLEHYDSVQPGFANRIVAMAEKEQSHRHNLENQGVSGAINKDSRGQHYALITSILLIASCAFLIYSGHEVSGSILGGGSLTGLAYIFISGRKKDRLSKEES
ncbi:DUF2335 domain-containing protein [Pseudoalteromonas rhizosphaerae]|uniref:DUF2335 domain-containing protein n=1 Tax=Pseudoalteromonas rhizosphaerae TaxID=2518973 RepID=UPI00384B95EF